MKRSTLSWLALTVAVLLGLSACNSAPKEETPKEYPKNETLYVGTPVHNGLYNPLYAATPYDMDVCNLIYEGLVIDLPDGITKVSPRLVEDFSISQDETKYTFVLKEGITFSDGSPLTAEDVVFTYQALGDPSSTAYRHQYVSKLKGGSAYMKGETTEFQGVRALDQRTVEFAFEEPLRSNLKLCGVKIINEDHYPDWEQGNIDFVMHEKMGTPIGSGPYQLAGIYPGEEIVLEKNPDYWANDETKYEIPRIVIRFISNQDRALALEEGRVDVVPQIIDWKTLKAMEEWKNQQTEPIDFDYRVYERSSYGYVGFNTANSPTSDVALRQAIAYGFPRRAFVEEYFGVLGETIAAPLPSASDLYYLVEDELNPYEYDKERAQKILEENGYVRNEEGQLTRNGTPVVLQFLVTKDNVTLESVLPLFESSMEELGIRVDMEFLTYGELVTKLQTNETDWNLYFAADDWHGDDPSQWEVYFSSDAIPLTNVTRYQNERVDTLLEASKSTFDVYSPESLAGYKEVLLQLNEDLPELPIYTSKATTVVNKRIQGMEYGTYQRWSEGLEHARIVTES